MQLELKILEQGGGGALAAQQAASAVEAEVEQRKFVLLVHSEDTELLPEQRCARSRLTLRLAGHIYFASRTVAISSRHHTVSLEP